MVTEEHRYLEFTVEALSLVSMWPEKTQGCYSVVKKYYIILIISVTTFPILADAISQFYDGNISLTNLNENFIALSALYGVIYVSLCFMKRKHEIKSLVDDLSKFELYSPLSLIMEAEKSIKFYTKFFIIYGIVGNIFYGLTPFLNYQQCQKTKTAHMLKYGIPCGLVVKMILPFKFDYSPIREIIMLDQILVCTLCTAIITMVTMLICGVLIHINTHLKYLSSSVLELSSIDENENLQERMKFCVKFHTALIDYATRADSHFSQMMLLHITWTGLVISILGFEIVMTDNHVEAIRFVMHLSGWLGMLFLICYYGQNLMDKSLAISEAAYSFAWYDKPVSIQKYVILILVRSQKPLTLKAVGLKVMSLATFLGVMYSAYSYFTLLLKLKP